MDHRTQARDVEDNSLADRVLRHWQKEFDSATVVSEPCEYFYTDHVWPAGVYERLLRLLPPADLYEPLNIKAYVNAKGVSTRDKCYLPDIFERMDPERAAFWHQIWLALTAEPLKRLIFRKFKNDIALRLGVDADQVEDTDVSVHMHLTRDIKDYRIKPHPDGARHIVTAQFYFPADMSQADLGTSFYVERAPMLRPFLGRYKEMTRMRFAPNSGYFFAVNDLPGRRSLHGRERIQTNAAVRNSLLVRWSIAGPPGKRSHAGLSPTHQLFQ
jgi:hypothetical protein